MEFVEKGDKVQLSLEGKLENGEIFYKKDDKKSFIVIGEKQIFPALEKELIGMKSGDTKIVTIESQDAFGEYKKEFAMNIPKNRVDPEADMSVGNILVVSLKEGKNLKGVIIEDCENSIKVDFNHPHAGKKLVVTCTIISIEKQNS
jgi:FKBP-type peptidyl-prolyl cis-trans isomerase 2